MGAPVDSLIDTLYSCSLLFASVLSTFSPWIWLGMVVENLGLGFALHWFYSTFSSSSHSHETAAADVYPSREQRGKYKHSSLSNDDYSIGGADDDVADVEGGYYPGLVNISGTYCFLNSVLQAFASLNYLIPYVDAIQKKAVHLDVPTPVVDSLRDILATLNTQRRRRTPIRPIPVIEALSAPARDGSSRSLLFSSREHQDAQELFQLLSSLLKDEANALDREAGREFLGLNAALDDSTNERTKTDETVGKGVFDGLTANKRSCVVCGYTEAVMHFGFDNLQLSLPFTSSMTLEEVLEDLTRIEILTDCVCRKCSLLATQRRLLTEIEKLAAEASDAEDGTVSQHKKKRLKEAKKFEARVTTLLQDGRIEEDVKGLKMERSVSRASTKQVMIARAPPVLVLHLNRSFWGHTATKNSARVSYPELLDLTPYTTSGQLSTSSSLPLSASHSTYTSYPSIAEAVLQHQRAFPAASSQPTSLPYTSSPQSHSQPLSTPKVLYMLSAIVCHYGGHAFGHYICYRRKPRPTPLAGRPLPNARFRPRTLDDLSELGTGRGWLRLSDDIVDEVGIETVLSEQGGVFIAFYERIDASLHNSPLMDATNAAPRETSRGVPPRTLQESASGLGGPSSLSSRASTPRVVHNVSAGIHTFSRPRTRETSPRPVLRSSISESTAEDGQVLSSSTDTITPLRASTLPIMLGKRNDAEPAETGEGIWLRTLMTPLEGPSSAHVPNNSVMSAPNETAHPSKKHRSRHRKGKSKVGS